MNLGDSKSSLLEGNIVIEWIKYVRVDTNLVDVQEQWDLQMLEIYSLQIDFNQLIKTIIATTKRLEAELDAQDEGLISMATNIGIDWNIAGDLRLSTVWDDIHSLQVIGDIITSNLSTLQAQVKTVEVEATSTLTTVYQEPN